MTQSATLLLFTRRQSQSPRPVDKPARAGHQLPRQQQAAGRRNAGLHRRTLLSPAHAIHPLLRPAMEELFEEFQPAFLANAAYRFRNRTQFWPISAHNHLLLKSDRARVVKPSDSAHFSVRYCLTASPDAIEARLKQRGRHNAYDLHQLSRSGHRQVPDTMRYLSEATGPHAPFEEPHHGSYRSRWRKWPFARLGSTLSEGVRDMFAESGDGGDEKAASRSVR
jgi:hypothetical protein